jgi:DNA-directed RNA polymerase subunit RPC12/RpoP
MNKEFKKKPTPPEKFTPLLSIVVTCPKCGLNIELWNDEDETVCKFCGYAVFKHEKTIN